MQKHLCCLVMALSLGLAVNAQEEWVSFGSKSIGSPPEISVSRSDNQAVSFTVSLAGMYVESKTEASEVYTRLSMPQCNVVGEVGSPEIPVVTKMVAIPECSDISFTVSMSGQQTFTSYVVYPVAETPSCGGNEIFTINPVAYSQNQYQPSTNYEVLETGYLRSQRYLQLELHPVQYNPVTGILSVATDMEVNIAFTNATTPVNSGLGIFNNVGATTMVNYEDQGIKASINDKAFEKTGFQQGSVQAKIIWDDWDLKNVTADYLIICSKAFCTYSGVNLIPHSEILRLAEHRAWYNGFDVLIVCADNLISDNTELEYEGQFQVPIDTTYKKEQRIRTAIKTIYENGTANHTMDGKLGYVLLVGDSDEGNTGMPVSYDLMSAINTTNVASDYYYSCITKDKNNPQKYDRVGDLYIGRFCVPNNLNTGVDGGLTRLSNMVTKTINFETDFDPGWKKHLILARGRELGQSHSYMNEWGAAVRAVLQDQVVHEVDSYLFPGSDEDAKLPFREQVIQNINSGALYLGMYAHGNTNLWWGHMLSDTLKNRLNNTNMTPFVMSGSCSTGYFDEGISCLAEEMTSYSDSKGFIATLAPSRIVGALGYNEQIPISIYGHLSFITGEFILATKIAVNLSSAENYNLFGDPALNIMAEGYEVWRFTELPDSTVISCPVVTYYNGRLQIPEGGKLFFTPTGSLRSANVHNGGLIMKKNTEIRGIPESNQQSFIRIEVHGFYIIEDNVTIENMRIQIPNSRFSFTKAHFKNVDFVYNGMDTSANKATTSTFDNCRISLHHKALQGLGSIFNQCDFIDSEIISSATSGNNVLQETTFNQSNLTRTTISHSKHKLIATNCTFSERSDVVTSSGIVDIQNCTFSESGFKAGTPRYAMVLPFTPSVNVTGSSFKYTGEFITGYDELERPIYSTAAIKLDGIKEFQITGNTIINGNIAGRGIGLPPEPHVYIPPHGEGIYLNNAGQGPVDNRLISGNDISNCETGLHVYGSKATVKNNDIYHNKYGIRLFNNSSTTFTGEANIANGQQFIRDNSSYELYSSNNTFPIQFKYNQVIDEDNDGNSQDDPMIYYDVTRGIDPGSEENPFINLTCNYWGESFDHSEDIYPSDKFLTSPTWDPQTGECSSAGKGLYETGIDYFINEDYLSAQATFLELIETYPDDPFAIAALHELFVLEQFLDNDYAALHDYYAAFTAADSSLFDVADFLATRCNVVIENWQPAIDWYEDRIENPPSYQDSVFAVIDLGDILLMMEEDTSFLKSGRTFLTRFPNIKPKSKQEYEENKSELLATLPKIDKPQQDPLAELEKKGVLSQNIPNPATGSTTIVYDVIEEGSVELRLYNQLGQLLQALPQGTKKTGSYRVELSLAGLPAGMYHYVLFVEGEKADAKKLIVN